ncbi:MAG: hypothetical protein JW794_09525 [Candidatus Cloacimonetes bacterium]|nr:hypothetical protein [Candidatus Cloacimonadota bacterium]
MNKTTRYTVLILIILLSIITVASASAEIIQNDYVIISYNEEDRVVASTILDNFSKIVSDVNREVGFYDIPAVQLVLTHSKKEFDQYITQGNLPENSIAMAIPSLYKIIVMNPKKLPPHTEFYKVITHEYLHLVLHSIAPIKHLPLWFEEGFVQYYADEWNINREMNFVTEALKGNMLELQSYSYHYPEQKSRVVIFYLQSYYNFRYLIKRFGVQKLYEFIDKLHLGEDFNVSFMQVFGMSVTSFLETAKKSISSHTIMALLYSGLGLFWIIIPILLILAYLRKQRYRRKLEAIWENEEQDALSGKLP